MINHLAIIMDGNRRFSKRLMQEPWLGHIYGAKKVKEVLEWCRDYNIKELTLYTFSYENFRRPKEEFDALMKLFSDEFTNLIMNKNDLEKNQIKIRFVGELSMFPKKVQKEMKEIMDMTSGHNKYTVNFAMAYSSRIEVIKALKKIVCEKTPVDKIDEKMLFSHLDVDSEPDLIIRTGGEKRLSNFLMFQSAYSELFFIDTLWPEFSRNEFDKIIEDFNKRDRRFGK